MTLKYKIIRFKQLTNHNSLPPHDYSVFNDHLLLHVGLHNKLKCKTNWITVYEILSTVLNLPYPLQSSEQSMCGSKKKHPKLDLSHIDLTTDFELTTTKKTSERLTTITIVEVQLLMIAFTKTKFTFCGIYLLTYL